MPFRTVAERFHLIDSPTKTVYIPLGDGEDLAARLLAGEQSQLLYRQIGQYSVTVYEQHYQTLLQTGDVTPLDQGSGVLNTLSLYDEKRGLSLEADWGKAILW